MGQHNLIIIWVAIAYTVGTAGVGVWSRKFAGTSSGFMTGGKDLGTFLVGVFLMSQWVAAGALMGTAETAFNKGISASWNLITLAIAQVLFGIFMAKKYHQTGEYSISGVIEKKYGKKARTITSLTMIYAMTIVNVSFYVGGAATLSVILGLPTSVGLLLTGLIAAFFVSIGGLKGVVLTNAVHAVCKYLGVGIVLVVAVKMSGGVAHLRSTMQPTYFSWTGIGVSTIFAWMLANIGAVFCTQNVIQAIGSMNESKKAIRASVLAGILIVPVGFAAAFVGVAAKSVFPGIRGAWAIPKFAASMNPWLGGVVVASLIAAVFGSLSANALGSAALIMRDFYVPSVKPSEKHKLVASRVAAIVIGLVPIPFALFLPELLKTLFFARALRTTISLVAVCLFYAPFFSSGRGVVLALIASVIGTTSWYLLGNPFGIDNTYIALILPLVIMGIDHLVKAGTAEPSPPPPVLTERR